MSHETAHDLINLDSDPFVLFQDWLQKARETEPANPNAMILSTSTCAGYPSSRVVLLKDVQKKGFIFYTNRNSLKGREIASNPHVALLFYWKMTERQVRIHGECHPLTSEESDHYFATRRRLSKIGAIASEQSDELTERGVFERRIKELEKQYPTDNVPRPQKWQGYGVVPEYFEFWQERPYRLHDRGFWKRSPGEDVWVTGRLYP